MELTAKAVNQSTQDQLMMAKQLQATGEAVARLTLWQMKMESGSSIESPRSEMGGDNPFASRDPTTSGPKVVTGPNRAGRDQVY